MAKVFRVRDTKTRKWLGSSSVNLNTYIHPETQKLVCQYENVHSAGEWDTMRRLVWTLVEHLPYFDPTHNLDRKYLVITDLSNIEITFDGTIVPREQWICELDTMRRLREVTTFNRNWTGTGIKQIIHYAQRGISFPCVIHVRVNWGNTDANLEVFKEASKNMELKHEELSLITYDEYGFLIWAIQDMDFAVAFKLQYFDQFENSQLTSLWTTGKFITDQWNDLGDSLTYGADLCV